nr:maco-A 64 [Mamestra configurata nucleopolyhedrovirus A]
MSVTTTTTTSSLNEWIKDVNKRTLQRNTEQANVAFNFLVARNIVAADEKDEFTTKLLDYFSGKDVFSEDFVRSLMLIFYDESNKRHNAEEVINRTLAERNVKCKIDCSESAKMFVRYIIRFVTNNRSYDANGRFGYVNDYKSQLCMNESFMENNTIQTWLAKVYAKDRKKLTKLFDNYWTEWCEIQNYGDGWESDAEDLFEDFITYTLINSINNNNNTNDNL